MDLTLEQVARRVNWHTPPADVLSQPRLFLCEVMARGGLPDILAARQHYPIETFTDAYRHAPPGLFDKPSWAYWGLVLLGNPEALPRPVRFPEATYCPGWRGRSAGRWG